MRGGAQGGTKSAVRTLKDALATFHALEDLSEQQMLAAKEAQQLLAAAASSESEREEEDEEAASAAGTEEEHAPAGSAFEAMSRRTSFAVHRCVHLLSPAALSRDDQSPL